MLTTQNEAIRNAYERLQHVSSDEKMRAQAISREKALRDWNSSINGSYRAGFEQGENVGFERGESVGAQKERDAVAASMVSFMKSRNDSDEVILDFLMNTFPITAKEAAKYLKREESKDMKQEINS
ncbi:MAG: hypothetical protein IJ468_05105 [Lachnospiraceae bacterium]|nr:hypothetical protein [Lachnospiraceae bacterium]